MKEYANSKVYIISNRRVIDIMPWCSWDYMSYEEVRRAYNITSTMDWACTWYENFDEALKYKLGR